MNGIDGRGRNSRTGLKPTKLSADEVDDVLVKLHSLIVDESLIRRTHQILVQGDVNELLGQGNKSLLYRFIDPLEDVAHSREITTGTLAWAFDCIALLLVKCHRVFIGGLKDDAQFNTVITVFTDDRLWRLLAICFEQWDQPSTVLHHKIRNATEGIIQLRLQLDHILPSEMAHLYTNTESFLSRLRRNLLRLSKLRRATFMALATLMPYLKTDDILTDDPNFVSDCLLHIYNQELGPLAAKVGLHFIQQHASTHQLNDEWTDLWLEPVTAVMASDVVQARMKLCDLVLPPLISMKTESFNLIMQNLDREPFCRSPYLIDGQIALLKVAKSLDILSSSIDARHHDILTRSMYSVSPSIRLDAFGFVCESRKGISRINNAELEFVQRFMVANSNIGVPDFRQRISAILAKFFARLISTSYAAQREAKNLQYREQLDDSDTSAMKAAEEQVDLVHNFAQWLLAHVQANMFPGAGYARIDTALRQLPILFCSGIDKRLNRSGMPIAYADRIDPRAVVPPFAMDVFSPSMCRLLLDSLLNPYEDIRSEAYSLVTCFQSPLPGLDSPAAIEELFDNARELLLNNRGPEADAGASLIKVIFFKILSESNLELRFSGSQRATVKPCDDTWGSSAVFVECLVDFARYQIAKAKKSMLLGAQKHPLHGTLRCLCVIVQELDFKNAEIEPHQAKWKSIIDMILALVDECWTLTKEILCNASPEGNLSEMFDDAIVLGNLALVDSADGDVLDSDTAAGPKTQVISSYAWRVIREASTMLGYIVARVPISNEGEVGLLDVSQVETSGLLFQEWMSQIRHRGAFSSVSPGFSIMCQRLFSDQALAHLPKRWLHENLKALASKGISFTRRSAGIPTCIIAILVSSPDREFVLLRSTMEYLFNLSKTVPTSYESVNNLPQVHAINVVKTTFVESRLKRGVMRYVEETFIIATEGMSSPFWPIRNASVMLFSALLDRALGSKRSRDDEDAINKTMSMSDFFTKYPSLLPFFSERLANAVQDLLADGGLVKVHHHLYPILTLLSRMSTHDTTRHEVAHSDLARLVISCGRSSIFKVREMAATALIPLLEANEAISTTEQLLKELPQLPQNALHGNLAHLKQILISQWSQMSKEVQRTEQAKMIDIISRHFEKLASNNCRINAALFLDLIRRFMMAPSGGEDSGDSKMQEFERRVYSFCEKLLSDPQRKPALDEHLVQRAAADMVLHGVKVGHFSPSVLLKLLDHSSYEVQLCGLEGMDEEEYVFNRAMRAILTFSLSKSSKLSDRIRRIAFHGHDYGKNRRAAIYLYLNSSKYSDTMVEDEQWQQVNNEIETTTNMILRDALLVLLGRCVAINASTALLSTWTDKIVKSSNENETAASREAAMASIEEAQTILFNDTSSTSLELCFALCVLLEDDDPDIRDSAAVVVSSQLSADRRACNQARALELLWSYMAMAYSKDEGFHKKVMDIVIPASIQQEILSKLDVSRVLFEVERANLFIEDVKVVDRAVDCLQSISEEISSANKHTFADRIQASVVFINGLKSSGRLTQHIERSKPQVYRRVYQVTRAETLGWL